MPWWLAILPNRSDGCADAAASWMQIWNVWNAKKIILLFWRSIKYEDMDLNAYDSIADARRGLGDYFDFYNKRWRHEGLDNRDTTEYQRIMKKKAEVWYARLVC